MELFFLQHTNSYMAKHLTLNYLNIFSTIYLWKYILRENLSFRKNEPNWEEKIVIFNLLQSNFSKRK